MTKPELLGLQVNTPDGKGAIVSLHDKGVGVQLHNMPYGYREMYGTKLNGELQYIYPYEVVEVLKARHSYKINNT